jgi:hypothetical protein
MIPDPRNRLNLFMLFWIDTGAGSQVFSVYLKNNSKKWGLSYERYEKSRSADLMVPAFVIR